jgi:hypothetical protein
VEGKIKEKERGKERKRRQLIKKKNRRTITNVRQKERTHTQPNIKKKEKYLLCFL